MDNKKLHIGQKLRKIRLEKGVTQEELGKLLNVTFQQVQKYETAANRISAESLAIIAEKLSVPIEYFYDLKIPPEIPDNDLISIIKQYRLLEDKQLQNHVKRTLDFLLTIKVRIEGKNHA